MYMYTTLHKPLHPLIHSQKHIFDTCGHSALIRSCSTVSSTMNCYWYRAMSSVKRFSKWCCVPTTEGLLGQHGILGP